MSRTRAVLNKAERAPASEEVAAWHSLAELRTKAQIHRLRRHQRIAPSTTSAIYFVKSGIVALESRLPVGSRVLVEILYPGDVFALNSEHNLPGMAFVALTATEVLKLSKAAFVEEIGSNPTRLDWALEGLQTQRARSQLHVAINSTLSSEQRVAALLIELASRLGSPSERNVSFGLPLSRTDIANYLSLNPDTLSRIMSRLKAKNLIERSGRSVIRIRDWAGLIADCPLGESVCQLHRQMKA